MDIQLRHIILGICVDKGHFTGTVCFFLHGTDFSKQHVTCQIAALPGGDGSFIPADFTVVEYNDLLRLEVDLTVHNQLTGNNIALSVVILQHVINGTVLIIVGGILNICLAYGSVFRHFIPKDVGQSLRKFNDFDLLAEDAYCQCVDIFRISGKQHIVLYR